MKLNTIRRTLCDARAWLLLTLAAGIVPAGQAEGQGVTFRDDHTILVEGEPFFPIGLYYCDDEFSDESGALLREIGDYGFNTAGYYRWGTPKWRQELERADQLGFKVWIRGVNGLAIDTEQTRAALKEQVEQTKDMGALLFWEFQDEPLLNNVPIDQALEGQALVRLIDPRHPTLLVEWPGAVARFSQGNALADIYATDLYPIPREKGYGALPNKDITQMRDYLQAIREARGDRPMMLVLQAWSWDPLKFDKHGYPTPHESRFMAYQAVIHGAKALCYYGQYHCTRPNSASALYSAATDPVVQEREFQRCLELNRWFWDEHREFFKELSQARRLFVLPDAKTPAIAPGPDSPGLESLAKQSGERHYLLAANASPQPATREFRLAAGVELREVHVLFEGRTLPVTDGTFHDEFGPYDVRVYATADAPPE